MIGATTSPSPPKPKQKKKGLSRLLPSLLAPLRRLTGSSFARSFTTSRSPRSSPAGTPPDSSLNTGNQEPLSPSAETSSWTLASSSSSNASANRDETVKIQARDRVAEFGAHSLGCEQLQGRMPSKLHDQYANYIRNGGKLDQVVADAVAHAVRMWAEELGASHFAHWLHPLTRATSLTTSTQTSLHAAAAIDTSSPTTLDASFLPHGSLRSPVQAAGYTAWDMSSPIVLVDGVVMIPSVLVSHSGDAVDEKMPLIRAEEQARQRGGECRVACRIRVALVDGKDGCEIMQRVFQQLALVGVLVASLFVDGDMVEVELSPVSPSRALDHCDLAVEAIERAADEAHIRVSLVEIACKWTVSHPDLDPTAAQVAPLVALDRSRSVISAAMDLMGSAMAASSSSEYWANLDTHLSQVLASGPSTHAPITAAPTWISLPPGTGSHHFPTLALCALTSAAAALLTADEAQTLRDSALSLLTPTCAQSFIAAPPAHTSCVAALTESTLLAPGVFSVRELHAFIHATMSRAAADVLDDARTVVARVQGRVVPRAAAYRKMLADAIAAVLATGVCEEEDVRMERESLECVTEKSRDLESSCARLVGMIGEWREGSVEEVWKRVVMGGELRQAMDAGRRVASELQAVLPKNE